MIIFSTFNRLGSFPQVFGQVRESVILELHEMIGVLHVVACPIDFSLLCDQVQHRRVLKLMKNDHFFCIFSHLGRFPEAFGQVKE